jgi:hypothetical protein
MKFFRFSGLVNLFIATFMLFACGSGGGSGSGGTGTGTLSLNMVDNASGYNAVYITLKDVQIHAKKKVGNNNNSWQSVIAPTLPKTIDLLELVNDVRFYIGAANLSAGDYTQMRLIVDPDDSDGGVNVLSEQHPFANYVIDSNNIYHQLEIPSGDKTGFKVVHGFTIYTKTTTELNLDFDVCKSVIEKGDKDPWILKPAVKVFDDHEKAIIRGQVTDNDTKLGIPRVLVSVQNYDDTAADQKDKVIVHTSTITSSEPGLEGNFSIFVEPGTPYNLVAYKDGYHPDFGSVPALAEEDVLEGNTAINFILKPATITGTVSGRILISGTEPNGEPPWATLSFRQQIECGIGANSDMVELKSVNVETDIAYNEQLPVMLTPDPDEPCGDYQLVVSSYERGTEDVTPLVINSGINDLGDITLTE